MDAAGAPVDLLRRATERAVVVMARVMPAQLTGPTPCSEWDVQALMNHLAGGPAYLLAALGRPVPSGPVDARGYDQVRTSCLDALTQPGACQVTCMSPLGFEWTVAEATAGTFMDQLVHTWDLAAATGQDTTLDPDLVQACIVMFLPDMPERGRAAGLIGPAISIPEDASPKDRLLAAMGRRP